MEFLAIAVVVLLKFILPVGLLWWPFAVSWLNYLLDVVDGDILLELGMTDDVYQMVDKASDLVSYVFMLLVGLRWNIKKTIIVLFVYRIIGQIIFFATKNEFIFIYFQNFLEPLVMIYALLIFQQKSEKKAYGVYQKYWWIVWIIILTYKIWNEWYLHWANIDLSQFFFGFTGGGV